MNTTEKILLENQMVIMDTLSELLRTANNYNTSSLQYRIRISQTHLKIYENNI